MISFRGLNRCRLIFNACTMARGHLNHIQRPQCLSLAKPMKFSTEAGTTSTVTSNVGRSERLFGKVELELRAHQPAVLKSYAYFIETTSKELEIKMTESEGEEEPHKVRKTLLKSVFVHSKARAQYEMRTYYWTMAFEELTESTKDTFLEYIQRNLPEGVAMRVVSHEWKKLPETIGQTMLEDSANTQ